MEKKYYFYGVGGAVVLYLFYRFMKKRNANKAAQEEEALPIESTGLIFSPGAMSSGPDNNTMAAPSLPSFGSGSGSSLSDTAASLSDLSTLTSIAGTLSELGQSFSGLSVTHDAAGASVIVAPGPVLPVNPPVNPGVTGGGTFTAAPLPTPAPVTSPLPTSPAPVPVVSGAAVTPNQYVQPVQQAEQTTLFDPFYNLNMLQIYGANRPLLPSTRNAQGKGVFPQDMGLSNPIYLQMAQDYQAQKKRDAYNRTIPSWQIQMR